MIRNIDRGLLLWQRREQLGLPLSWARGLGRGGLAPKLPRFRGVTAADG
jgi:hypothetical protein